MCRQVRLGGVTQTVHVHSREVWVERHPASQQADWTTPVSQEKRVYGAVLLLSTYIVNMDMWHWISTCNCTNRLK